MPSLPPPMRLPRAGMRTTPAVLRRSFIPALKIAERAPIVDNGERRFAIVYAGHASCITKLDEALGEVVGFRSRIHPVPGREKDVIAVDRRPGTRHPTPP